MLVHWKQNASLGFFQGTKPKMAQRIGQLPVLGHCEAESTKSSKWVCFAGKLFTRIVSHGVSSGLCCKAFTRMGRLVASESWGGLWVTWAAANVLKDPGSIKGACWLWSDGLAQRGTFRCLSALPQSSGSYVLFFSWKKVHLQLTRFMEFPS